VICLVACMMGAPAWGTNNAAAAGTVGTVFQYSTSAAGPAEAFFQISNQPNTTCASLVASGSAPM